mmetsp:Transcript_1581/g.3531  ORF Transcript_1581/g.3531 Transcript_1581/m.3531 type:complete len:614 (+) Transcript_1581:109-1950(+)
MFSKLKKALKLKGSGGERPREDAHHNPSDVVLETTQGQQPSASTVQRGEGKQACLFDPFVSEAAVQISHECVKQQHQQQHQQQLPTRPERTSPTSSAAASKYYAALQALARPDHACQSLPRTFTTSSTDSSSVANALQPASSKGGSSMQPLSSKDNSLKSMPSLRHAHMGTLASSGSVSRLTHQNLESPFAYYSEPTGLCTPSPCGTFPRDCQSTSLSPSHSASTCPSPRNHVATQGPSSDPSIAAHKQHRACVPQSHSTGDLSRSGSKQVNFHCAPSSCGLAISKERNRSTGDLGSSTSASGGPAAVAVAEHAREGLQPLAHDYSGREEGANPAYLEERMLGVLGLCNGGHQDVPPTSPVEIPTSRHNTDNKMLGSLSPGGVIPVSRLGSGSSSKAGRRSFHEGSRRLGNRNHGSHPLEGRRLGNNSTESSLRSIASSGSEHRLGSLDLGPLCNSLALQGCSLHAMGRARVLKEQHQQHHHHRQHHQHGPVSRTSMDQLRDPVSAAVQIMARSSMEQHLNRSTLRKSFGDLSHAHHHVVRKAAHLEPLSSRKSLSVEGPLSSPGSSPGHAAVLPVGRTSSGSLPPSNAPAARANNKNLHLRVASPATSVPFP